MNSKHRWILASCFLCAVTALARDEFRNWTNADGRVIEASFAGLDGAKMKLKLRNGSIAPVALEKLSAADQEWVKAKWKCEPARLHRFVFNKIGARRIVVAEVGPSRGCAQGDGVQGRCGIQGVHLPHGALRVSMSRQARCGCGAGICPHVRGNL